MGRAHGIGDVSTSVGPTIVSKAESIPVSTAVGETQKGFQEVRGLSGPTGAPGGVKS